MGSLGEQTLTAATGLRWSADGSRLAFRTTDTAVSVWDARSRQVAVLPIAAAQIVGWALGDRSLLLAGAARAAAPRLSGTAHWRSTRSAALPISMTR